MDVKYSFVVPIYNVERYLEKCIDSILKQTLNSYEIIIIDDGSPDSSGEIADRYQKVYPQKILTVHQENRGLGGARNTGIGYAHGKYIVFVDSDDFVVPNMLEIAEKYFSKYNDDILCFDWQACAEKDNLTPELTDFLDMHKVVSLKNYIYMQPSACRKIYKACLFNNIELRFPEQLYYEDLALSASFVVNKPQIGVIKEKLYYYVQHRGSIMQSKDKNKMLEIISAFDYLTDFFKRNSIFEEYRRELEWLAIQHVLLYSTIRIFLIDYDEELARKLREYVQINFPEYRSNVYIDGSEVEVDIEELRVLLNGEYKRFDRMYCKKLRVEKKLKDLIRLVLQKCGIDI